MDEPIMQDTAGTLGAVHKGMCALSFEGFEMGTVDEVRLGEPDASQGSAETTIGPTIVGAIARGLSGGIGNVHPELAAKLNRVGYFRIDGKAFRTPDLLVSAEDVLEVVDDTVRLKDSATPWQL